MSPDDCAKMHFNLANCVLYPILEAMATLKLFPYLFSRQQQQ